MNLIREETSRIAEKMIQSPNRVFQLRGNGDFGYVGTGNEFRVIKKGVKGEDDKNKIVWSKSQVELLEQHPSMKYKTYISEYLYEQVNLLIQKIQSNGLTGVPEIDAILQSAKYQEYLTNEPVEITHYENTESNLRISAPGTSFANHQKLPLHTLEEVKALHEEVRVASNKDDRAIIHRPYKKRKFIERQYKIYEKAYAQYEKDFNLLRKLWDWKMNNGGVRMGYTNDDIYKKIILPVEFRLQEMKYEDSVIREMNRMVHDLKRQFDNLNNPEYSSIHIYL